MTSTGKNLGKTRKVALSVAAAALAAALIGVGAYAEWSTSTSQNQTVSAGSVNLSSGIGEVSMDASDIAPGDTIQRRVTLTNDGTLDLGSLTLVSSGGATPPAIYSGPTGLTLTVDKCVGGTWSAAFACSSGSTASVFSTASVDIASPVDVKAALDSDTAGGNDALLFTVGLPSTAPDTMQGQSVTITYTFDGTQRAGTAK